MKAHNIPNLITFLRIVLVAPFLWLLLDESYGGALLIFVIAGLSDALDGFLAKHYGWTSELGGVLDPLADKLLLLGAIIVLGWLKVLPVWLVVLIVFRDVVIVAGAIGYHILIERFQAEPLILSKLNTFVQLGLVFMMITHHSLLGLPEGLINGLIILTALTTTWSGIAYVLQWGQRACHKISCLNSRSRLSRHQDP
ncbi:MAG: CDP-alcohol phosphatidyltransferase [Candidatus Contendobacter odensis]|uniref:CDP-diacylglycerol--glycerol-3-phosphate 3-phosphatidyltransferase n=1 Tax=Candidatus Contendibacter odensensis TaxID=1400860 RepID=A0A2G6PEM2_9GAMM|nr:MAG: CDP-alcohol phosphatidyltransferase [Candidatus Contendobacter odensis]